jgi:hypothetical protein
MVADEAGLQIAGQLDSAGPIGNALPERMYILSNYIFLCEHFHSLQRKSMWLMMI